MVCVTDDFNRADNATSLGVATSGETWTLQSTAPYDANGDPITAVASILGINANQAYSSDTRITGLSGEPGYANIATIDDGESDIDVTIGVVLGFNEGGGGGLTFRWSSATAFWLAFVYRQIGSGNYFVIVRKQTGAGASYDSRAVVMMLPSGSTGMKTLRLKACRQRIRAWLDGALAADFTDSFNQTATAHGIVGYFSNVRLDDLSVCPTVCGGWVVGAVGSS